MRFDKSVRLLKSSDYDYVFQQPIKINQPNATLYARANNLKHARLGLLVSKRALRHAVERNRVKRLVRESFRAHLERLKDYDIVFVARSGLLHADNASITLSLEKLWEKIR
ncbi:MAG TPA: ribonuclease P protein component [Gammaproteobacteria bacterium]|nr:ribonuclease P protein component [Gammaproteobacteria bacterium]